MKKFLLSSAFALLIINAFAQIACPLDTKRNNGNGGCQAGQFTFTYDAVPSALLRVSKIFENGIHRPDIITVPVAPTINVNKKQAVFCFSGGNLDPAALLKIEFWNDLDNDGQIDGGEPIIDCLIPAPGPLPVVLGSFNALNKSGKVSLNWETFQEIENDGFEIERRMGNGHYQKIGFVDSKAPNGNGAAYSYNFDDNLILPKGVTYYRLRQVDLDGRATYSEVKAVRAGNSQLVISIYPNPNRGTANIAIPESAGKMDVKLSDYTGKSIQQWSGINVRNLQVNNMKPGIYMLRINLRETGETITERIIVQ